MAKKPKIGIIYSYDENWIGGTYYLNNLCAALGKTELEKQPEIIVFTDTEETFMKLKKSSGYPFLTFYPMEIRHNFFQRIINKISRTLISKNLFEKRPLNTELDLIFPNPTSWFFELSPNKLYWIPDFQELKLPQFFNETELTKRKENHNFVANSNAVVFSSKDAENDFNIQYPDSKAQRFVLNFAVHHPDYTNINLDSLLKKYKLPKKPYFFVPNQFWQHKNHMLILRALILSKQIADDIQVFFSGKEFDHRNPDYITQIRNFVKDNHLTKNVHFLGFINRVDQLALMRHSKGLIQPSLFEGWSTVIEDGKSMGQRIIASNLNVHKEQLANNNTLHHFVDIDNEKKLSEYMLAWLNDDWSLKKVPNSDYNIKILNFANDFLEIVKKISQNDHK
jgi:glycosyltransferase involved in cell wall biosynthesis